MFLGEALDHAGEGVADPLRGEGGGGIVARAVAMHAAGLQEGVVLRELGLALGHVDGEGLAAVLPQEREDGDVAGAVGDVDHVLEGHAAVLGPDDGVDVDPGVLVRALVDLEEEAGLDGVVDHRGHLGDLGRQVQRELVLLGEVRGQRMLEELAAVDAVAVLGERGAADHLGEAGADDVVLEDDLDVVLPAELPDVLLEGGEELREARAERDLGPELAEAAVGQALHEAGLHVAEQVVEVDGVLRRADALARVQGRQLVGLLPELLLVDAEGLEKRGLHVPRTEGLVEVPHAGDDVGATERGFLGLHIGRKGMKVGLAEGSLPHSIE